MDSNQVPEAQKRRLIIDAGIDEIEIVLKPSRIISVVEYAGNGSKSWHLKVTKNQKLTLL
jgi:hypothetical protein